MGFAALYPSYPDASLWEAETLDGRAAGRSGSGLVPTQSGADGLQLLLRIVPFAVVMAGAGIPIAAVPGVSLYLMQDGMNPARHRVSFVLLDNAVGTVPIALQGGIAGGKEVSGL